MRLKSSVDRRLGRYRWWIDVRLRSASAPGALRRDASARAPAPLRGFGGQVESMKRFLANTRVRVAAGALAAVCALAAWIRIGPLPDGLLDLDRLQSTVLLDRNGEVL